MLFAALLWALVLIIYFSDKRSKINQWCALSGLVFSLGPFKEYFFFDLAPSVAARSGFAGFYSFAEGAYSAMTAGLYDFVMPCMFIFALYFFEYPRVNPRCFRIYKALALLLPIALLLLFPPLATRSLQQTSLTFWYTLSAYNVAYGVLVTVLIVKAMLQEKWSVKRREKRRIGLVVLPPLWFWLTTIFIIHSLRIEPLFKAWQGNTVILAILFVFYIASAFREGMMGLRLRGESYRQGNANTVRGAQYTSHILKSEVTKIEWCVENIRAQMNGSAPEELDIISRSTAHLKKFINKTQLYASDVLIEHEPHPVRELIDCATELCREYAGFEITFDVLCGDEMLVCDKDHVVEVLNNLIMNAADAMNRCGVITIGVLSGGRYQVLYVRDTGCGISQSNLKRLYEPYFTTKSTSNHFGLGLAYCFNVMKKHNGYIDVQSKEGQGTTFYLHFPRVAARGDI